MKKTEVVFVGGRLDGMSVEVPDFVEYVTNQEETYARIENGFALFNGDPDGHTAPITDIVKGGHGKSYDPYRALSAAVLSRAAADLVAPNPRNERGLELARASAVAFLSKRNSTLRMWCDGAGLDMDYVVSKYPDILKRKLRIQELAGDLRLRDS